jgi:hypothetical protein
MYRNDLPHFVLILMATGLTAFSIRPVPTSWAGGNQGLADQEAQARVIDRAAKVSLDQAIQQVRTILKTRATQEEDEQRRLRLIELLEERSQLAFRIATASLAATPNALREKDQSLFLKSIDALIEAASEYINRYPSRSDTPRVYWVRAQAHEEKKKTEDAKKDYLATIEQLRSQGIQRHPLRSASILALAQIEASRNQHAEAARFLHQLDAERDDSRWMVSRLKLCWALHNVRQYAEITHWMRETAKHYQNQLVQTDSETEQTVSGDASLRDSMWLDLPLFAAEEFEKAHNTSNFLGELSELIHDITPTSDESSLRLRGRMQLRMAKLLRSQKNDSALEAWVHFSKPKSPSIGALTLSERIKTVWIVIDYFFQKALENRNGSDLDRALTWVNQLAREISLETPELEEVRQSLAAQVQTLLDRKIAEPEPTQVVWAGRLTEALLALLSHNDSRRIGLLKNYAEALFASNQYQEAEKAYTAALQEAVRLSKPTEQQDLTLRKVGARIEALRKASVIPQKLMAVALNAPAQLSTGERDQILEALDWLKNAQSTSHSAEQKATEEALAFALYRALYRSDRRADALAGLEGIALSSEDQEKVEASSALLLDTALASNDTALASKTAETHLQRSFIRTQLKEHTQKLQRVYLETELAQLQSRYQTINTEKDPSALLEVLSRIDHWIKKSPPATLVASAFALQSQIHCSSSVRNHSRCEESLNIWEKSLKDGDAQSRAAPLLLRSELALREWNWKEAEKTLNQALNTLGNRLPLNLQAQTLKTQLDHLQTLLSGRSEEAEKTEVGLSLQLLKTTTTGDTTYRKRLKAVRAIARSWKDLSDANKNALLGSLVRTLPTALTALRLDLKKVAPLIATPKYIQWRIDAIRELEAHLAQTQELPYAEIRIHSFRELAAVSVDLAHDLKNLGFPRNATAQERQEVRDAVLPLLKGVEEKALAVTEQTRTLEADFARETELATQPSWAAVVFPQNTPPSLVETLRNLIEQGNLPGTLALLEEARKKTLLEATESKKLISLAYQKVGLQSEANLLWKETL